MLCKVEDHLGDLHSKIDRILCLINPEQDTLLQQANRLEKFLNVGITDAGNELEELSSDYPMFNFYKGSNRFIVTVKSNYM